MRIDELRRVIGNLQGGTARLPQIGEALTGEANAAYNLGLILISLGDYPAAELRLREAQAELARAGENLADVLLVRARLAQFQNDFAQLAHLAERVLAHPQSEPEPAHRVQALALLGTARFHQGHFAEAEQRWQQAIEAMPPDPALPLPALPSSGCTVSDTTELSRCVSAVRRPISRTQNPNGVSPQSPGLATRPRRLPWVRRSPPRNLPQRGCGIALFQRPARAQPRWGRLHARGPLTQGSSFLATLGFEAKPRWGR